MALAPSPAIPLVLAPNSRAAASDLDIGWASWFQDYPHPNDFFQPLLSEESIFPTNTTNLSRFADPKVSAKIAELAEEPLTISTRSSTTRPSTRT